jgi:hypothetical protein
MFFGRSSKVVLFNLLLILGLFLVACSLPVDAGKNSDPAEAVVSALEAAGAGVEVGGQIEQPFFSVNGQVLKVNGSDLQLFTYEDEAAAEAEAGQVAPDGSAVGTSSMMWLDTPHFYRSGSSIGLYLGDDSATLALLEEVFGPQFAGGSAGQAEQDIADAALSGLAEIGWDITGFAAETQVVDGDYARVLISSSNPPGGFTAYMIKKGGAWTVAAHGSAFNPAELSALGIPDSVLP